MATVVYSVTNASVTTIAAANGNRKALFVANRGTARAYISDQANVTSAGANGATLDPGEGYSAEGERATRAHYCIASVAGAQRIEVLDDT